MYSLLSILVLLHRSSNVLQLSSIWYFIHIDKLKSAYLSLLSGRARIDPVLEVLGGIAIAGVVGVASWRVSNGEMLVGDVLGFITALLMLVQPVRALGTLNAVTQEGVSAANRALELLATEPDIQSDKNAIDLNAEKAEIEFSNVSFSYDTAPILQDITFTIKAGETVALVGESGAGKTEATKHRYENDEQNRREERQEPTSLTKHDEESRK